MSPSNGSEWSAFTHHQSRKRAPEAAINGTINRQRATIVLKTSVDTGVKLTRNDLTKDLSGWSPKMLMKAAAAREDFSFYASADFLKWAALHRRHLAIHHYPEVS